MAGSPGAGLKLKLNQPYFKASALYMNRAILAPVDLDDTSTSARA